GGGEAEWPRPMTITSKLSALDVLDSSGLFMAAVPSPFRTRRQSGGDVSRESFQRLGTPVSEQVFDSLADAELREDGAKHLLDVDPAGQPRKMAGREAKLLGLNFRPSALLAKPGQRLGRRLELGTMARTRDNSGLAGGKPLLGAIGQNLNKFGHASAGLG